jgi:hypothetical protein
VKYGDPGWDDPLPLLLGPGPHTLASAARCLLPKTESVFAKACRFYSHLEIEEAYEGNKAKVFISGK